MRFIVQFGIPILIFLGVVYAVARHRRSSSPENDSGAATYVAILVIGAVVAVATLFVIQVNWDVM